MITDKIKHQIRSIVGPENALDSDLDRFGYSYDSSYVPPAARKQTGPGRPTADCPGGFLGDGTGLGA